MLNFLVWKKYYTGRYHWQLFCIICYFAAGPDWIKKHLTLINKTGKSGIFHLLTLYGLWRWIFKDYWSRLEDVWRLALMHEGLLLMKAGYLYEACVISYFILFQITLYELPCHLSFTSNPISRIAYGIRLITTGEISFSWAPPQPIIIIVLLSFFPLYNSHILLDPTQKHT